MADKKYISKVRIGSENYSFRDTEALAAAQQAQHDIDNFEIPAVPVNGVTDDIVFKDANGKFYKLALTDGKVKLVAVSYSAPTASITAASWNGISARISSGNASITRYVDEDGTGSVTGTITGSITTANAVKPTVSDVTGPTISNDASPWIMGGTVAVNNNASVTIKYNAVGTVANPSTNQKETATRSFTISRTATVESGVVYNVSDVNPASNITGGFKFGFADQEIAPTAQTFANNTTVELTSTGGYVYIFTNAPKSFVLSTDKATIDSAKLGGGVIDKGTVKTYSIQKTYYAYRSLSSFASGTKVYVKSIV